MKNSDMPAMPVSSEQGSDIDGALSSPGKYGMPTGLGLTKREHAAIEAMNGLLSRGYKDLNIKGARQNIAAESVRMAEALLAELERKS